jgi:hypothetical protein
MKAGKATKEGRKDKGRKKGRPGRKVKGEATVFRAGKETRTREGRQERKGRTGRKVKVKGKVKVLVLHRETLPQKSVILKHDLLLLLQKRCFYLDTKSKCQYDNEVPPSNNKSY